MVRSKYFVITLVFLSVYLLIFYMVVEIYKVPPALQPVSKTASVSLPYVVVHLDLKGAPPKLAYLHKLLPILKNSGANGLLMEYEDMFPYSGKLANISARNCYGRTELKRFIINATKMGFEVIPLVQTFGHMEYVLKLSEFQHLREDPTYPDSICPSKEESFTLITEMLRQIIEFHNSVKKLKYIHIGCDEVWHTGKCTDCKSKNTTSMNLYLEHIRKVANTVSSLTSTKVLIWDDMIRKIRPFHWQHIDEFKNVEPVFWNYEPKNKMSNAHLLFYNKKFSSVWTASAFKGADGNAEVIPNFKKRYLNHFNWMTSLLNFQCDEDGEKSVYNFNGIILTGWSRYTHFDPLCELWPVSLPSLFTNLLVIRTFVSGVKHHGTFDVDPANFFSKFIEPKVLEMLSCYGAINFNQFEDLHCVFEENSLYRIQNRYVNIKIDIVRFLSEDNLGVWALEHQNTSFINLNSIGSRIDRCRQWIIDLTLIETTMKTYMVKYYEDFVINEYVDSKTHNLKLALSNTLNALYKHQNMTPRTWDRRPYLAESPEIV